ncbi:hypothetical protein [Mucisphaera sp.]|uniref:hypothetical protein n=1 Tax=Mucisphaera sp. TaxID=2913024 RepID=UPI003D12D6BA
MSRRTSHFLITACWTAFFLLVVDMPARAQWVEVDPPRSLAVQLQGGERLRGRMVGYDEQHFRLQLGGDEVREIRWDALSAAKVLTIHRSLLRDVGAEPWLRLGALLGSMEDGAASMETALARAERLDESVADRAQAIREGEGYEPPGDLTEGDERTGVGGGHEHGQQGPVMVGGTEASFWGNLSPELMAASVDELKAYGEAVSTQLSKPLALQETEYFLFYSDLPAAEARRWASLLDRMYRRLCGLFEVPRNQNVFRGKAFIVVFSQPEDYYRYHAELYGFNATQTAGLCRAFGNGYAKVSFYRQRDMDDFAYILVHETVHAFLHRFESPERIPSWVNEGLAELIASEMVEKSRLDDIRWVRSSLPGLRQLRGMGGMTYSEPIAGWQYGVAHRLTAFMIEQDRGRYRAFVMGIKEGLSWQEALEDRYGISLERLVAAWGETLGIQGMRP